MFENNSQEFEEHFYIPFNKYTPKVSKVCHL